MDYYYLYGIYAECHMCEEPCSVDSVTHNKLLFCSQKCLDAYQKWAVMGGANRRVERQMYANYWKEDLQGRI